MTSANEQDIINQYLGYINSKEFACVGAKAAVAKGQIQCFIAAHLACPNDDNSILNFLYAFVEDYRNSNELYHSAAVIFKGPDHSTDEEFDRLMWQRLQSLSDLDAANYSYDRRVTADPFSADFSFSIKEESFFIIGLHPLSSRPSRRFDYPVLVFNPHVQFEQLRHSGKYENLQHVIRKRDIAFSGSINPMLRDYGKASEVYQYSGREYDDTWQCPLKIKHGPTEHNTIP